MEATDSYNEEIKVLDPIEITEASVGFRETDGVKSADILDIVHDDYAGSLKIAKPSIDARIRSGNVISRYLPKNGETYFIPADGEDVALVDVLATVETYCSPVEGESPAPVFAPSKWASEALLLDVYRSVKEYHSSFR